MRLDFGTNRLSTHADFYDHKGTQNHIELDTLTNVTDKVPPTSKLLFEVSYEGLIIEKFVLGISAGQVAPHLFRKFQVSNNLQRIV